MEEVAKVTGKMTVTFENQPFFWGLVLGGAHLTPFIWPRAFLLDSNAVTRIKGFQSLLPPEKGWWENILNDGETLLNPFPFAMEGGAGSRMPTRDEFEVRFKEGVAHLKGLGNAQVVEYEDDVFDGMYTIVEDVAAINYAESKFLVEIAPRIKNSVKVENLRNREEEILDSARRHGLTKTSLSLYAALSCIYRSRESINPAGAVLKPGKIENAGNAYNAIADLSMLRLFVASLAMSETMGVARFALLTGDLPLRNFWMGLEISNPHFEGNQVVATYEISEQLFPIDADERLRLRDAIKNLHD